MSRHTSSLNSPTTTHAAPQPGSLLQRVGRALGLRGNSTPSALGSLERLEERSMLEGTFGTAIAVGLNGQGRGTSAGTITPNDPATDSDFYRVTVSTVDFVTFLADTSNSALPGGVTAPLDTRIELYDDTFTLLKTGNDNSTLSSGLATDGWIGFVPTLPSGARTYYIKVLRDTGTAPTGSVALPYVLRVATRSTGIDVGGEITLDGTEKGVGRVLGSPVPDFTTPIPTLPQAILAQLGGTGTIANRTRQDEVVYQVNIPNRAAYDSITQISAISTQGTLNRRLDTRIDVYDAAGTLLASDSDAGRINDAFVVVKTLPGQRLFVRFRSDEIRGSNIELATGPAFLVLDALAQTTAINPVTRLGGFADAFEGFAPPPVAPNPNIATPGFQTASFSFTAQGTGTSIITAIPTGLFPVSDPALRLIDKNGVQLAFNNDFAGSSPQLNVGLAGGERYFYIVDGFEINSLVQFVVELEANHTVSANNDDHVNSVAVPPTATPQELAAQRRQFEQATPLVWGTSFQRRDADGNFFLDHAVQTTATGTGRLQGAGDNDLFSFVPQVNMLSDLTGNNDDLGTTLFAAGGFQKVDPANPWNINSGGISSWDAGSWGFTGSQQLFDFGAGPVQFGFVDNPTTAGTARAEIYAQVDWQPNAANGAPGQRRLIVGGDFDLNIPVRDPANSNPLTNIVGVTRVRNIAMYRQNPTTGRWFWSPELGSINGPVRALTSFDPVGFSIGPITVPDPNAPTNNPWLVAGGQFTAVGGLVDAGSGAFAGGVGGLNLARFDGAWTDLASDNPVLSLLVKDGLESPGSDGGTPPFTFTPPTRVLFVGHSAATAGTRLVSLHDGQSLNLFAAAAANNNSVNAIALYNEPDGSVGAEGKELVAFGGRFNNFNYSFFGAENITARNVVYLGRGQTNAALPPSWQAKAVNVGTATDTVFALRQWDPADINGNLNRQVLVIGGSFTQGTKNNLIAWDRTAFANQYFGTGTNGPVHALAASDPAVDVQEPTVAQDLREFAGSGVTANPQSALYVGGSFTTANGASRPGIAQFSAFRGAAADGFTFFSLDGGVANQPGSTLPAATVFSLGFFREVNANEWDRNDRRATRLAITVSPTAASFINSRVRVFDSKFNVVYDFTRPGSDSISPGFPDPSGMLDFSYSNPAVAQANLILEGIKVWAGETYYLEVSDLNGPGTGRYNITVTADAEPPDLNADGSGDQPNGQYFEEPDSGQFTDSIAIAIPLLSGDNYNRVRTENFPFPGNSVNAFNASPSTGGVTVVQSADWGLISSVGDTDIYSFRAEATGTTEIRLATRNIGSFNDFSGNQGGLPGGSFTEQSGPGVTNQSKIFDSRLDGAIRVFRNDFEQIGYNDNNIAIAGDLVTQKIGIYNVDFTPSDPRVVIPVIAGNTYFIQVESGQFYTSNAAAKLPADRVVNDRAVDNRNYIDARTATGAYMLFVNSMSQQDTGVKNGVPVQDDHSDITNFTLGQVFDDGSRISTVIPINDDPASPLNGTGSITGSILNFVGKNDDNDTFSLIAPGDGTLRFSAVRTGGDTAFLPDIFLVDDSGNFIGRGTTQADGSVTITTRAVRGERFVAVIFGQGNLEGSYRLDVSGVSALRDFASISNWSNAQDLRLQDSLGQFNVPVITDGPIPSIEVPGDTDIFRFTFEQFQALTITVQAVDPTLDPIVFVYETSEDPSGNPVLLRIGWNDNAFTGSTVSQTIFPVSPSAGRVDGTSPVRTYPYYYVVVAGADPLSSFGRYNLTISFPPTDDHPDALPLTSTTYSTTEFGIASSLALDPSTGFGQALNNRIELTSDSDLFFFTPPASGPATVTFSRPGSTLRARVSILDSLGNVLAQATGTDSIAVGAVLPAPALTLATRGTQFFVLVEPFANTGVPNVNTTLTGTYNLAVQAAPIDDHPNETEFPLATIIPISTSTGIGRLGGTAAGSANNARLSPTADPSDLFTFTTIADGNHSVEIAVFDSRTGALRPVVTLFRQDTSGITLVGSQTAPAEGTNVTFSITPAVKNTKYFVLVTSTSASAARDSEYAVTITGPAPTVIPPDPAPGTIDFAFPTVINLDARNGEGSVSDRIDIPGDRDLFTFTTAAAGKVFVQVRTPTGSLLDGSIRILNAANEAVPVSPAAPQNTDGIPGTTAYVMFDAPAAGTQYWVVVSGVGGSTGSYIVDVKAQPVTNFLYFPEGFASNSIREFVSIINPNNTAATYTIRLRYEFGPIAETVLTGRSIPANSRGGETIVDTTLSSIPGLQKGVPYSIILESNLPLGATLAHYDFGGSVGDGFTDKVSASLSFPRVQRNPGEVLDFITLYNPNNFRVAVTLTAYASDGSTVNVNRVFEPNRRGGFAINDIPSLPNGVFSVVVTSRAESTADQAAFIGLAGSLSHYEIGGTRGAFAYMADPTGGSTAGAVTDITRGATVSSQVVFFNSSNSPATVNLNTQYIRGTLPAFDRSFQVPARSQVVLNGTDLSILPDQPVGLRYTSDQPISVVSFERQNGDANGTLATNQASTRSFIGDAFISVPQAGIQYFETLYFYNPSQLATDINVKLLFFDGTSTTFTTTVAARSFGEIKLDQRTEILSRGDNQWFGIDATAATPFIMNLVHYDLVLGGGWATGGVPFGLIQELSRIG